VLNRIRRAIARTRERHAPNSVRSCPAATTHPTPATPEHSNRPHVIAGEETVLVRPYMLAAEERASRRSAPAHHNLVAHTWFVTSEAV
jgi:hypothetical protein